MPARTIAPYGSWPSPITAERAAAGTRRFGSIQATREHVWWTELRPEEKGRQVIYRAGADGKVEDVLPAPYSARSGVHEYGGGEFLATDEAVYFINNADQDIYTFVPGQRVKRLTAAEGLRFADMQFDASRKRLIAVAERHAKDHHPENLLVTIGLDGVATGDIVELTQGMSFFASPRISKDGKKIAFLAWSLPDMPWDSAALYVADLKGAGLGRTRRIAGGANGDGKTFSAIFQPEWAADGTLYFVSDLTGMGQLMAWDGTEIKPAHQPIAADLMRPQWVFGMRSYATATDGSVTGVFLDQGAPRIEIIAKGTGKSVRIPLPETTSRVDDPVPFSSGLAALVSTAGAPAAIYHIGRDGMLKPVGPAPTSDLAPDLISAGEIVALKRDDGVAVHAIYYPPKSATHEGPKGSAPPLLVLAHGGPTSRANRGLAMRIQYFTSRGFAVCDVDYAGSVGYGRKYQQRLDGQWGIADVADCAAIAKALAADGRADPERCAIAGGSAGGYTVLMAMATTDVFRAGSCHYGISDMALLLAHTHKFESGYLHRLMGTAPDRWEDVFAARSPLNLVDGVKRPIIFFQGLDDKVVPPEQTRVMLEKLTARGIAAEAHEFVGEGHGFRRSDTIIAVLTAELAFLSRALGLAGGLAGEIAGAEAAKKNRRGTDRGGTKS